MSNYERVYGTDWDELDGDEAVERAYALGVAESMGEYDREELQRLAAEVDSAYRRSLVELAFEEGRKEAKEFDRSSDAPSETAWHSLIEGETVTISEDDVPTGGRDGLPETLDSVDALDRPNPGENEAVDRPDFLDR
ncbi:MAG: hypothetical protein ABEI96_05235 [Haloarculaceae archaeon]